MGNLAGDRISADMADLADEDEAAAIGGVDLILGRDLRAIRRSRHLSLTDVAGRIQRSIGFLSQIERGLSTPSIHDLRRLAEVYSVPLSLLFGPSYTDPSERDSIVRKGAGRRLGSEEHGLVEELLSPDLGGAFEIVLSRFSAGAAIETPLQRATEEAGHVMSGVFELELDGMWRRLKTGDSFRIRGEPYRWRNRGEETAVVLWVISPPIY